MRSDMAKKLVERGRGGAGWKRKGRALPLDHDQQPRREPMSMRRGTKWFGENLAPLERFLRGRVGQPWDRVYSEIRARLSPHSTVQMHIMQHLEHLVERHAVVIDGTPHHCPGARAGRLCPLSGYGSGSLYVDARGILQNYQRPRQRRRNGSAAAALS